MYAIVNNTVLRQYYWVDVTSEDGVKLWRREFENYHEARRAYQGQLGGRGSATVRLMKHDTSEIGGPEVVWKEPFNA